MILNLLLDTHVFIWAVADPSRLGARTRTALTIPANQVLISSVTAWEIAIKQALGQLKFPLDRFDDVMHRMGFDVLPILPAHAVAAGGLPRQHDDPFDRMLIAQAWVENLTLVSAHQAVTGYDVSVLEASA